MRINGQPPVYVFALNQATREDDIRLLRSVGVEHFNWGKGVYNGVSENSYIVSAENFPKIKPLLHDTDQQCVLFLDNQRNGSLYFGTDDYGWGPSTKHVGEWKEVSVTQAAKLPSYSVFEGKHYACR